MRLVYSPRPLIELSWLAVTPFGSSQDLQSRFRSPELTAPIINGQVQRKRQDPRHRGGSHTEGKESETLNVGRSELASFGCSLATLPAAWCVGECGSHPVRTSDPECSGGSSGGERKEDDHPAE